MSALFSVVVLELFLGGGGRLIEIGPLTLRMVFFVICVVVSAVYAFARPKESSAMTLAVNIIGAYFIVHLPAVIVGLVRGSSSPEILTEMQQSLYWLAAPFFALTLARPVIVRRLATLVRLAGVILAAAYLLTLGAVAGGYLSFLDLYARLSETGEFFFRGESFFVYKGFLYLGISAIFFIAIKSRYSALLLLVVLLALVMTLTRGFVISTSITALLLLTALRRWRDFGFASLAVAIIAFAVWVFLPSLDSLYVTQREVSNSTRSDDLSFMLAHIDVGTVLLGNGFGTLINERVNVENTFLWALWRLGFLGVIFWLMPLALSAKYFFRVPRSAESYPVSCAFFFGVVLVYLQTLTNPFLNNPIGLSFVMMALFSLRTLALGVVDVGVSVSVKVALPELPSELR